MRRAARPRPEASAGTKVDARSERWREHRIRVRAEIVDAAFRAIDRLGPEVSLREIAEEAGTAKPKIYRHFVDKSDLFGAIGERLRDMLGAAIYPAIDLEVDPAGEVVRRGVAEFVKLVDSHPNVLRFVIQGRFADQSVSTVRALSEGQAITLQFAEMFSTELRDLHLDPAALELAAHATFGSAAAATDWWLGSDVDSPRRMPPERYVEYLTTIMMGTIDGTAALLGVRIDPGLPIHDAVQLRDPSADGSPAISGPTQGVVLRNVVGPQL